VPTSELDAFTDENRAAQATVRGLIWNFYRDSRPIVSNC
jgi:hypothetical protein